ncbi:MAG: transposase [Chitinispirillaceae bacterium]
MHFIADNFDLPATTLCDLYKARWDIELFFKQVKQTPLRTDLHSRFSMQSSMKYEYPVRQQASPGSSRVLRTRVRIKILLKYRTRPHRRCT